MLIRPKRIYNFCLFHAYLCDFAICFDALSYHLQLIWTNLLTKCSGPVFVCFCPCIAEKGENQSARKKSRKIPKNILLRKTPEAQRGAGGRPPLV